MLRYLLATKRHNDQIQFLLVHKFFHGSILSSGFDDALTSSEVAGPPDGNG